MILPTHSLPFFLTKERKQIFLYTNFYKEIYMLENNIVANIESFCCAVVRHKKS